jgi:hypothetical protein
MNNLIYQRCYNHRLREAVPLCPECGKYFCRECITEHDDRVLCANCLNKIIRGSAHGMSSFGVLFRLAHLIAGIILLWVVFYYFGQILISLPSSFHEGTIWSNSWMEF